MTKFFNSRPIFIGAISLIVSIITVSCYLFFNSILSLICLILLGFSFLFLLSFLIVKLSCKQYKASVPFLFAIFFILIGAVGSIITILPKNDFVDGKNDVQGCVNNVVSYTNVSYIELTDVTINGAEFKNKIQLKCFNVGTTNLCIGNIIALNVKIVPVDKTYDNIYYIFEDIGYTANCNISDIQKIDDGYNIKEVVKSNVKNNLDKFLNKTNSAIAFSVLFGSKDGLPSEIYNAFSFAGIAHILAVSGLHIGFLVAVLTFLLNVIKCNKTVRNIILILTLLIYAYLCNFTASVTRAVIMSIVLLISKSYSKEYDALNSLSLSAILILTFAPISIFLKGFQLSFLSVFSIITLSSPIKQVLAKIKCPEKLSESISMSLAVNFGILCVSAEHFKQINFVSIFSNMFTIPVFSICFSMLFLIGFIGVILPFLNYLLIIPNIILHFIKLLANFFANINLFNFELFKFGFVFVALSILASYILHFALIPKNLKRIVCGLIVLVIVVGAIVVNIPLDIKSNLVLTSQAVQGNYVFIANKDNSCLVVNGVINSNDIIDALNQKNINKINFVVVNNYSANQNTMINEIVKKYNVENVYVENLCADLVKSELIDVVNVIGVGDEFVCNNIEFSLLGGYIQDNFGIQINFYNNKILLINNNANSVELNNYFLIENNFDCVICYNYTKSLSEYDLNVNKFVDDKSIQILNGNNLFVKVNFT